MQVDGSGHWICSSSVGTDCGEVLLMDSLISDINKLMILQIAQIYKMGKLSWFPQQSQHTITHSKPKVFNVKVHCMCCMPDNFDENMIQCTNCRGWYHYRCVKMRTKRSVPVNWKCSKCLHGKKQ